MGAYSEAHTVLERKPYVDVVSNEEFKEEGKPQFLEIPDRNLKSQEDTDEEDGKTGLAFNNDVV